MFNNARMKNTLAIECPGISAYKEWLQAKPNDNFLKNNGTKSRFKNRMKQIHNENRFKIVLLYRFSK